MNFELVKIPAGTVGLCLAQLGESGFAVKDYIYCFPATDEDVNVYLPEVQFGWSVVSDLSDYDREYTTVSVQYSTAADAVKEIYRDELDDNLQPRPWLRK
mgnify:CR=1 FL=1